MVERFLGRNVRREDKKQCNCRRGWRVLNVFFLALRTLPLPYLATPVLSLWQLNWMQSEACLSAPDVWPCPYTREHLLGHGALGSQTKLHRLSSPSPSPSPPPLTSFPSPSSPHHPHPYHHLQGHSSVCHLLVLEPANQMTNGTSHPQRHLFSRPSSFLISCSSLQRASVHLAPSRRLLEISLMDHGKASAPDWEW